MAQPDHVPVTPADRVRELERLPAADPWVADRPGELPGLRHPEGRRFGTPGPDQGYGLKLARRFADRLQLGPGEERDDAIAGCLGVALKRAALFGRAPVVHDLELAYTLFGFLGGAPADLVAARAPLFAGASHHYWDQRDITDLVPEDTLRRTPADVRSSLDGWRSMLDLAGDGGRSSSGGPGEHG